MSCSRGGGRWRRLPGTVWLCSAPIPWLSALIRTHRPPRERDPPGRDGSQHLPCRASSRATCRQMSGPLTPCVLSAACGFQYHALLPDTGVVCSPPAFPATAGPEAGSRCPTPGPSGVRRALHRPTAQPAPGAPDGPLPVLQRSAGKQFPTRRGAPGGQTRSRHLRDRAP